VIGSKAGRTSIEEPAWIKLMMYFHEVFLLIKLAALLRRASSAASGEADT
jgi:hypothetical protein